jgi:cellular nucleic acid-binding protein
LNSSFSDRHGNTNERRCYRCGECGHMASSCPLGPRLMSSYGKTSTGSTAPSTNSNNSSNVSGSCYKCHETGHMARNCPNAPNPSRAFGGPRKCFNCSEVGHLSRDCPRPRQPRQAPAYSTSQHDARPSQVTFEPGASWTEPIVTASTTQHQCADSSDPWN